MFIYKKFDSSKRLDDDQYKSLKIYGMADIRNGQDTPFVECANKAQAEEAKRQGRSIVGITAVPFIAPFTSLGTEIHETHKRVNVSGAVWLRINPNAAFREYILSHDGDGLTTGQITVEFARGLELNLEPYLNHVVNTENVEQIQKHGVEAADISALPGQLPNWCEVVKVMLAVDGTATASRYTQTVAEALRRQEIEEKKKHEGLLEVFIEQVWPFWKKNVIDVLKHPFDNMVKFKRLCCTTLLLLLFGAWALRMIVFMLGGGSPFARKSEINFKSEKTASCNIQKFLLETYMADKFSKSSTSKGKPFGGFKFGETYHFAEEDAQTVRGWVDSYVNARHGTLRHVKNEYNHPHGIPKILGWSRPTYQCTVGMEGRLEPDPYHLVVENDYDGSVKRCLDDMLLAKGKTKKGVTEYKSLKLRDGDVDILKQALHDDKALAGKGVVVSHEMEHKIVVSVGNYTLNYQLDVSALMMFDDLLVVVKNAFQTAISREVFFINGKTVTLPLTNDEIDKLKMTLKANLGDKVVFTREKGKDGKTERLVFEMSEKKRIDVGLEKMKKEEAVAWWKNEEQGLFNAELAKAAQLEKAVAAVRVPENAADDEYKDLLDKLQAFRSQREGGVKDMGILLNQVKGYQTEMREDIKEEKDILDKAAAHQKELEKQLVAYGTMLAQLDQLTNQANEARWQAKAHKVVEIRRGAAAKYVEEAEETLKTTQADFRKEIPSAVQMGQTKEWYKNLEGVAGNWEAKSAEASKSIQDYLEKKLTDTFMLEKRKVTMDVRTYRTRLNAVLDGWSSMQRRALNCKQECRYKQVEVVFLQNQKDFWEKVEALNALEREIKECQAKLQSKRQEIGGLTREEIKARRTEIKDRIYQEIVLRSKELERKARGFIAYFNGLIPKDDDDSWHYEEMLGPRVLRRKDVESLNAEMKDKVKALLEAQENRLLNLKKGNRRSCLKGLKDQAENLEGAAGNLRVLDDDDILKVRNVWPLNN